MFDSLPDPASFQPRWEPPLDPKARLDQCRVKFTVDGDEYVVGFYRVPTSGVSCYYVAWSWNNTQGFWRWFLWKLIRGKMPYTNCRTEFARKKGVGYPIRVLAGVIAVIGEFGRVVQPSALCFHQPDPSFGRFNARVATKVAPRFGYRYEDGGLIVRADEINRPAVRRVMQQHREGRTPFTLG